MILSFDNESAALACLAQIDAVGLALFEGAGYASLNGAVVGKRLGVDDYDHLTTTWGDVIKAKGASQWYISSPNNKAAYAPYFEQLTTGHTFNEIELSEGWQGVPA